MAGKYKTRDELEAPEPKSNPTVAEDRNWLQRAGDAIDSVGIPIIKQINAFTGGANYGAFGEAGPYLSAIPRGQMPATIRADRDQLRAEHPGTFKAGDIAGTMARDLGVVAATGGVGAPAAWAPTLARGAVAGATSGILNEGTKFAPEAAMAGEDYDAGKGLLRVGANTGFGAFGAASGKTLAQGFSGPGKISASGGALSAAEQQAADRALRVSRDPRYGLQDAGRLNAAEAARAGTPEAPGLAGPAANFETLVRRSGSRASDGLDPSARAAAVTRAEPGGFLDQQTRAQAQKATAERVTDATMGNTPVVGARGGAGFTPERQMFTQSARIEDPTLHAQAYPIIKETIGKSLHPEDAARAAAAVGRASPEAARELGIDALLRNFTNFGNAMKGPVSDKAVASGAPMLDNISKSGNWLGAGASAAANVASKLTNPAYASASRLIHEAPEETLRLLGRKTPGMVNTSGVIQGLLDAISQQAYLRPNKPKNTAY